MPRADLVPDCASCAALCCVAPSFDASEDFALTKPAGVRCPNLTSSCRCTIHSELKERGFPACALYDCHGAGQRVTRAFAGQADAELARNEAFLALRVVHEDLWLLTEAARLNPGPALAAELQAQIEALDTLAALPMRDVVERDLQPSHDAARVLLRRVGAALRGGSLE